MDLPLPAGRIVMSMTALSSCKNFEFAFADVTGWSFDLLNAFSKLSPDTLSHWGLTDACLQAIYIRHDGIDIIRQLASCFGQPL